MLGAMSTEKLFEEVPEEARPTFSRLVREGVRSPAAMREQIPHYLESIRLASTQGGPPFSVGQAIARDCITLLDAWDSHSEESRALIRGAVEYFLLPRDGDDDLATPHGLDDDAAVVRAVMAHLAARTD